ncbi:uncharacterized protein LOC117642063 [Thrips palmi]|uniref:Uncharacterized protein LOC117642063 n=1 Tax=Thrips palmi TaxID=161013 RepID=A0A6P8YGT2_THRPL|nr:uncharacterized protein LOC117642063 [Thrips palmi]
MCQGSSLTPNNVYAWNPSSVQANLNPLSFCCVVNSDAFTLATSLTMKILLGLIFLADAYIQFGATCVPPAPHNLTVYRWNRTSVWVRWRPPVTCDNLLDYQVHLKSLLSGWAQHASVAASSRCNVWPEEVCWSEHSLEATNPLYMVTVLARNKDSKNGTAANALIDTSTSGAPQQVQDLRASRVKSRRLRLQWSLPSNLNFNEKSSFFRVELKPTDVSKPVPRSQDIPLEEQKDLYSYPIAKLEPNTTYTASVQIVTDKPGAKAVITVITDPSNGKGDNDEEDADENDGISFKELMRRISNS